MDCRPADIELTGLNPKSNSLRTAKICYKKGLMNDNELVRSYSEWVKEDLFLLFYSDEEKRYFAVKASKRGNVTYRNRTLLRFIRLRDSLKNRRSSTKRSFYKVVFTNLTYADSDGWETVGTDFNRFISALRKHGLTDFIRVWESQERGACHIHVLLFFDHPLSMFRHKKVWRLRKRDTFADLWPHGFSDFSGVDNLQRVLNYLLKYLAKTLSYSKDSALTLAKCWVHQKRAFSFSRRLVSLKQERLDISCITQTEKCKLIGIGWSKIDLTQVTIIHVVKWDRNSFDLFVKTCQTLLV